MQILYVSGADDISLGVQSRTKSAHFTGVHRQQMGELKAQKNPILKSGSQLSLTAMQGWSERNYAWTTRDTASECLIFQFVVHGPFQGFV
jgi:hypothetical protein